MLLSGLLRFFRKLFITATLALPDRKYSIWIACALVNRALRRDDLAATNRARAAARRAAINVFRSAAWSSAIRYLFYQETHPLIRQVGMMISPALTLTLSMAKSDYENRAKDRNRRRHQDQHAQVKIARESAVSGHRCPAHRALSECRIREKKQAKNRNR
jgi:hypothetical protein